MKMIPINNFDFLVGSWHVLNRKLKERLCGCQEWIEFDAVMDTHKILNGLALMDEMKTDYFGETFIGLSIRMHDPVSDKWTIYWADTANPDLFLKEQVKGKFEGGIGKFYGYEMYNNKKVKLRFLWKLQSSGTAIWEQAYLDETNHEWETNWTMLFTSK